MRIEQIIGAVDNPSAGPTYSVARLADELHNLGYESQVLTLGTPPVNWPHAAALRVHTGWLESNTGISLSMAREIRAISTEPRILHGHGVWRPANLFPLIAGPNPTARLVVSPRGMLSPWSMSYKAAIKRPFWHLLQRPALKRCHCFHVTATLELQDIRRLGLRAPVAVIPNGVDIPRLDLNIQRTKTLVFLSRIDPKKGLDLLLPAWNTIAPNFTDWNLVIAGPLTGAYAQSIQELARQIGTPRLTFSGQVLGEEKRLLLSTASLFVLPSYSENFGIAVAEALAHGTPAITTTETPWTDLTSYQCGWCIPTTEEALRETLKMAMSLPLPALHEMGMNGRKWMERSYAWHQIGESMAQTYTWLLNHGEKPDCVFEE